MHCVSWPAMGTSFDKLCILNCSFKLSYLAAIADCLQNEADVIHPLLQEGILNTFSTMRTHLGEFKGPVIFACLHRGANPKREPAYS